MILISFPDKLCKNCRHDEHFHETKGTIDQPPFHVCNKLTFSNGYCRCSKFNPISMKNRKEMFELMNDYQCEFEKTFGKLLRINIQQGQIPENQTNTFHKLQERCVLLQETMSQITWRLLFGEYQDFGDLE